MPACHVESDLKSMIVKIMSKIILCFCRHETQYNKSLFIWRENEHRQVILPLIRRGITLHGDLNSWKNYKEEFETTTKLLLINMIF